MVPQAPQVLAAERLRHKTKSRRTVCQSFRRTPQLLGRSCKTCTNRWRCHELAGTKSKHTRYSQVHIQPPRSRRCQPSMEWQRLHWQKPLGRRFPHRVGWCCAQRGSPTQMLIPNAWQPLLTKLPRQPGLWTRPFDQSIGRQAHLLQCLQEAGVAQEKRLLLFILATPREQR